MTDPIQEMVAAARRNQILEAAIKVFADKGFHRATIKDIARQAGIADGTIYNYFENKTALMLGILDRINESEQRDADLGQSHENDFETFMRTYLRQRFEVLNADNLDIFQTLLSEVLVNADLRDRYWSQIVEPTFALGEKHAAQWIEQGIIPDQDVTLILRMLSGMFLGLLMLRLMGDEKLKNRWDELPDAITAFVLSAIKGDAHHGSDNA